jgi:hypothetical protein
VGAGEEEKTTSQIPKSVKGPKLLLFDMDDITIQSLTSAILILQDIRISNDQRIQSTHVVYHF